ncbi:MAG: tRNA (guanosine(46)-N7)-methyltransferase TrmB [Gammaproteobacteria bacterium]|nr:tRNA (guanosine(46)-N7)-methyltransferase TrmB [Gammaproteobacteria bacterium]
MESHYSSPYPRRTIKSWTKREHGINPTDREWMKNHPNYTSSLAEITTRLTQEHLANRTIFLDIGCGDGQSLLQLAQWAPEALVLGVETHTPGVLNALQKAESLKVQNIAFFHGDILDLLTHSTQSFHFDRIHIYFSDPWPKKRHHKRRLMQESFLGKILSKLSPTGLIHIATDWEHYAQEISERLEQIKAHTPIDIRSQHPESAAIFQREPTKYERKAFKEGRQVFEFYIRKHDIF